MLRTLYSELLDCHHLLFNMRTSFIPQWTKMWTEYISGNMQYCARFYCGALLLFYRRKKKQEVVFCFHENSVEAMLQFHFDKRGMRYKSLTVLPYLSNAQSSMVHTLKHQFQNVHTWEKLPISFTPGAAPALKSFFGYSPFSQSDYIIFP